MPLRELDQSPPFSDLFVDEMCCRLQNNVFAPRLALGARNEGGQVVEACAYRFSSFLLGIDVVLLLLFLCETPLGRFCAATVAQGGLRRFLVRSPAGVVRRAGSIALVSGHVGQDFAGAREDVAE